MRYWAWLVDWLNQPTQETKKVTKKSKLKKRIKKLEQQVTDLTAKVQASASAVDTATRSLRVLENKARGFEAVVRRHNASIKTLEANDAHRLVGGNDPAVQAALAQIGEHMQALRDHNPDIVVTDDPATHTI